MSARPPASARLTPDSDTRVAAQPRVSEEPTSGARVSDGPIWDGPASEVRSRDERGQAAVEFVGLLSMVLVSLLAVLQLLLAGYCVVVQDSAVRAAATANARGDNPNAAARATMPDWLADRTTGVLVSGERVEIRVRVPSVLPGVDIATISRSAEFRVG